MITLLDGAMGTELERRGVWTDGRGWSAGAIERSPDEVRAIHSAYAASGATVHTANTFRTTPRGLGPGWERALHAAVALTRSAVPRGHRVAGSLAPLEDCWHPELSPSDPGPEQRRIAAELAAAGVDLLLCETFPNVAEALSAVEACVATGLPTWVSFSSGPRDDLLDPARVGGAARAAVERGAAAVLVNCVPAARVLPYVRVLAGAGAPFGAYANAGLAGEVGPGSYVDFAAAWIAAGATIIGGCCGAGPEHVSALSAALVYADRGRSTCG